MANTQYRSDRDRILDRSVTVGINVGAWLGIAVFVFVIFFRPWRLIMTPPENAVELLTIHSSGFEDTLYVRTAPGNIYAHGPSSHSTDDVKWRRVSQVSPEASDHICDFGGFPTPNPPGKIVGQLESHPCVLDSESQVNYIVLEDGSIWKWDKATGELDGLLIPLGVIAAVAGGALGVVAGMVVGLVTLVLMKK